MALSLSAVAQDIDARFHAIKLADRREAVIALMGQPHAETHYNTAGIQHSKLKWNANSTSYVVIFVLDRAVMTRRCQGIVDC